MGDLCCLRRHLRFRAVSAVSSGVCVDRHTVSWLTVSASGVADCLHIYQ